MNGLDAFSLKRCSCSQQHTSVHTKLIPSLKKHLHQNLHVSSRERLPLSGIVLPRKWRRRTQRLMNRQRRRTLRQRLVRRRRHLPRQLQKTHIVTRPLWKNRSQNAATHHAADYLNRIDADFLNIHRAENKHWTCPFKYHHQQSRCAECLNRWYDSLVRNHGVLVTSTKRKHTKF